MMYHTKRALVEKSPQKTLNQLYSGSKQELPLDLTTTTRNSSKNAGENFIKAMEVMTNIGWRKGELPSEWKTAIVKFLRKPGKSTYYSTSSYRPIKV